MIPPAAAQSRVVVDLAGNGFALSDAGLAPLSNGLSGEELFWPKYPSEEATPKPTTSVKKKPHQPLPNVIPVGWGIGAVTICRNASSL